MEDAIFSIVTPDKWLVSPSFSPRTFGNISRWSIRPAEVLLRMRIVEEPRPEAHWAVFLAMNVALLRNLFLQL